MGRRLDRLSPASSLASLEHALGAAVDHARILIAFAALSASAVIACSTHEGVSPEPSPAGKRLEHAEDVLTAAQQVAAHEQPLTARLARRGWRQTADGITSVAWAGPPRLGREAIAARLPGRADRALEIGITGSERLKLEISDSSALPSAPEVLDGRVIYRNTHPSTHTLFSVNENEAELSWLLEDARAPDAFTLNVRSGAGGLRAQQQSDQQIVFVDDNGHTRLIMSQAYAVDARGQTRAARLQLDSDRVHVSLDTTGLSYPILLDPTLGTNVWTQLTPATSPAGRAYYGAATLGTKVVMFGGRLAGPVTTNETWEWDGTTWTLKNPATRPTVRQPSGQMATFGSYVLLFSGNSSAAADTWKWDGTTWTQLFPSTSPPGRSGGVMSELNGSLYLFGGSDLGGGGDFADTWKWDGTTWSNVTPATSPHARTLASIARMGSTLILFGGTGGVAGASENDTWSFNGTTWTKLSPAAAPPGRIRAPMVSVGSSAVLFSGQASGTPADTWEWDGTTWTQHSPTTSPPGRFGGQLSLLSGTVVLFGGYDSTATHRADTWTYSSGSLAANGTACSTATGCSSGFCADGVCCNTACGASAVDCQSCNVAGSAGTCNFLGSSTVCRAASGLCDAADSCSGSSATCPTDAKLVAGTSCRAAVDTCDTAETCDGSASACPMDALKSNGAACPDDGNACTTDTCNGSASTCTHPAGNAGSQCRAAAGACDAAESCTGASTSCPSDARVTAGSVCRPANGECDAAESCDGSSIACPSDVLRASASVCTDDGNVCTRDVCDGASNACTHPAGNAGTVCRGVAGVCDTADSCNGVSTSCPADARVIAGTECRAASGACDAAESCDGSSLNCPSDGLQAINTVCADDGNVCTRDVCSGSSSTCTHPAGNAGTACRASAGVCDLLEACTGASATCPADVKLASTTVCRIPAGDCDSAENCDGSSAACPTDTKIAVGTPCRSAAGECDQPEACTGSTNSCPTDALLPNGTACIDDGNVCTRDVCDGAVLACTHPAGNSGTLCRAASGICDAAENCDGLAITCPPDGALAAGTSCRTTAGECDVGELCDGTTKTCPVDAFVPTDALCTDDGNPCSRDVCSGNAAICMHPAGNAGTECRAALGVCDTAEACTGATLTCPNDAKLAQGTICRIAAGDCDVAEACDGATNACAADAMAPSSTVCRASAGDCDVLENCSGSTTACPADDVRSAGTVCRTGAGECDVVDVCDGTSTACASDLLTSAGTPCADDGNLCTLDICSGSTVTCTHPAGHAGQVCRPANGECDVAESCDGGATLCPSDTFVATGSECRMPSCNSGAQIRAAQCSGASPNCPIAISENCDAYSCGTNACLIACDSSAECANDHYCSARTCLPRAGLGVACTASDACSSGACVDGYCCNVACEGRCEACDVSTALGTCSPVEGAPHTGRTDCDSDGSVCGGSCDGQNRTACVYPTATTTCRAAVCTAGVATFEAGCTGDGACGPLLQQNCTPFVCDTDQILCNGNCVSDGDCVSDHFCSAGVCELKYILGESCTASNQCASVQCVDTKCCDTACTQQCEACDIDGSEGTCSPVLGEPHAARADCTTDGSLCGGSCDATLRSACVYPDGGVMCRDPSCAAGTAIVAAFCDAAGNCPILEQRTCEPYVCGTNVCLGDCSEEADCVDGDFCEAGICTLKRGLGETCGSADACESGLCVDDTCCDSPCTEQCEACDVSGSEGTCSPVIGAPHGIRIACDSDASACAGACDGSSRTSCLYPGANTPCRDASCTDAVATAAAVCAETGACPAPQSQSCSPYLCGLTQCAGDCVDNAGCQSDHFCSAGICRLKQSNGTSCGSSSECQSDVCADGVCCNRACDGQCEACDEQAGAGECTSIAGAPRGGRGACAGTGTCAGSCDGIDGEACTFPNASVICTQASCSAGIETHSASCDAHGACQSAAHRDCTPYVCGTIACLDACAADGDCVSGLICTNGSCVVPPSAVDAGVEDASTSDAAMEVPDASTTEPEQDTDGDGVTDAEENAGGEPIDSDSDGVPDYLDDDDDGDGIPTRVERGRGKLNDLDRDGIPNHLDTDTDGDGIPDADERTGDLDGDGIPDYKDVFKPGVSGGALCSVRAGQSNRPGDGQAAWLLLGVMFWFFARRSRRVRDLASARDVTRKPGKVAYLLVVLALFSRANAASAESTRLDQYTPPLMASDGLQIGRPHALDRGAISALLVFDYADDPLVIELERGLASTESSRLVHRELQVGARFAYGVLDRLSVAAGLDFIPVMSGETFVNPATRTRWAPADGPGFGDARLGARYVAVGDDKSLAAAGAQAQLSLPLAELASSAQNLSGEDGLSFRPELLGEVRPGPLRFTGNVGVLLRNSTQFLNTRVGNALTFGAGASVALPTGRFRTELLAEVYGSTELSGMFKSGVTPIEALFGARLRPDKLWHMSVAAGPGLQRGVGAPDFRALAAVGFETEVVRQLEEESYEPELQSCPDPAADGSGTIGRDGCPEPDADGDMVTGDQDRCPSQAEDHDGFQDEDGCPDPDNDGDTIADAADSCPTEAEDVDGYQDSDGCPDSDNDSDGVADAIDQCPLTPGTKAQNGCTSVKVEGDALQLAQRVEFGSNNHRLAARSEPLMEEIRSTLERSPQIRGMIVEGHTDSSGTKAKNDELSKRRAQSVVTWLVAHGIASDRVQAWGCGSSRQLESESTEAGRQANRRVEFHIVDPAPKSPRDMQGCQPVEAQP